MNNESAVDEWTLVHIATGAAAESLPNVATDLITGAVGYWIFQHLRSNNGEVS